MLVLNNFKHISRYISIQHMTPNIYVLKVGSVICMKACAVFNSHKCTFIWKPTPNNFVIYINAHTVKRLYLM